MKQQFLINSGYLVWPLVALSIFFVTWIGVLINVGLSHRRGKRLDTLSRLPLDDLPETRVDDGEGKREVRP